MMAVDLHSGEELLFRSLFLSDGNNKEEEEEEADNIILSNPNGSTHQTSDFDVLNNSGIDLSTMSSSSASSSEQAWSTTETETETETDEDEDYIAELTRQMAHYMFQEDDKMDKSWELGSNYRSPKWPSHQEPISPPNIPACDEVTGKLEQLNINNQQVSKNPQAQQFQSMSPKPTSTPTSLEIPSAGFCSTNQALVDQIRAIQMYKMKQEQVFKQQGSANKESQQQHALFQKNRAYSANSNGARPYGFHSTPWPNQQVGSGMRAIFLGGSSSAGTGSNGTGVFLPCVMGSNSNSKNSNCNTNQNQSRKKRGRSPVLIPAKVLQALKVHFDRVGNQLSDPPEPSTTTLLHDNYGIGRSSTAGKCPEKTGQSRAVPAMNRTEIGLPQEWTY